MTRTKKPKKLVLTKTEAFESAHLRHMVIEARSELGVLEAANKRLKESIEARLGISDLDLYEFNADTLEVSPISDLESRAKPGKVTKTRTTRKKPTRTRARRK